MTNLEKPVRRRTRGAYRTLYARPRQIIVSLCPGDVIEMREAGARRRYVIAADVAFRYAVRLTALQAAAEKKRSKRMSAHG